MWILLLSDAVYMGSTVKEKKNGYKSFTYSDIYGTWWIGNYADELLSSYRPYLKSQVESGVEKNFALIVPTKALINEVTSKIINDLKENLKEYNYRLVTSAGALVLKEQHNFIFVLTPERLLYLLISNPDLELHYLFVDEEIGRAHV